MHANPGGKMYLSIWDKLRFYSNISYHTLYCIMNQPRKPCIAALQANIIFIYLYEYTKLLKSCNVFKGDTM